MSAENLKKVTEEEKQEEDRLNELYDKKERNEDEQKELEDLKGKKTSRFSKKIDKMHWEKENEREKKEEAEKRSQELEEENARLKKEHDTKPAPVHVENETITIGEKKYYTDEKLVALVKDQKMTNDEAFNHQRNRDRAEDRIYIDERLDKTKAETSVKETRKKDAADVVKEYPNFAKKLANGDLNPDFNANDPLYKKTVEIWQGGYSTQPNGMSKSLALAKEILGVSKNKPDRTDDFSLHSPSLPEENTQANSREIKLSAEETEADVRMYTNIINPKTNRFYTEKEAVEKAKQARLARRSRRL